MSLSIVFSRASVGINAPLVTVETHISNGLPSLSIVGLPETAVKESKDRVRSALLNSGFDFPTRRVTINLAPADLPKEGGRYDLAIAIGILLASGQVSLKHGQDIEFLGELALDGTLRPVQGGLPASVAIGLENRSLYLPLQNAEEAALSNKTRVLPASDLLEVVADLENKTLIMPFTRKVSSAHSVPVDKDLADVKGQFLARRALELAAAGGHNILFFGPPGTGKSMLASRLPGILPSLTNAEALEVASVHSVAGQPLDLACWGTRPFRSPHHTASGVALVGGGGHPKPGEISLAHHGVLFLDELPEYSRKVLEVLREPIESGQISISRASRQVTFPARFQLVAAMNPCPCGYSGHPVIPCTDTPRQISRYREKLSGPLLDRFDLHVEVPAQSGDILTNAKLQPESSNIVRARVVAARQIQLNRSGIPNQQLSGKVLESCCQLEASSRTLLETAMNRLGLSARGYHRVLRLARTIADLDAVESVGQAHISEALGYRKLDRKPSL